MNEQQPETPPPSPEPVPSEPPAPEPAGDESGDAPPLSISEHAKAFDPSPASEPVRTRDMVPAAEATEKTHPAAQQKRDKETGQFRDGKVRRRAQSQQATPDDVPRIKELTRQVRERDEELARLRAGNGHGGSGNGNPAGGRPVAAPAPQEPRIVAEPPRLPPPAHDPEPTPEDPKFGGDYGLYLRHQMAWIARDERRQEQHQEQIRQQRQHEEQTTKERLTSWRSRVDSAKQKYTDYEAVAFSDTPIQQGSIADVLIDQHDNGADLLYYLQSHPEERDSILQMPEHKQVVALSLLLQRFESTGSEQAGVTGSVATPKIQSLPAKPLNPVRTQAQRAVPVAPPMDGSLSIRAHAEQWHSKR